MQSAKASHLTVSLWLPFALVATLITAFSYLAVQQNYRMSANDPQVQIAHDAVQDLSQIPDLTQLTQAPIFLSKLDLSKVYNSFVVVYDDKGKAIAGNGYLNDQLPTLPSGVFTTAKNKGQTSFTWQPNKNLRFATVVNYFKGQQSGFVMAGRSLKETENREKMLLIAALITWLLVLLVSYVWCGFLAKWLIKHFAPHEHGHESAEHTHEQHHAA